MKILLILSDGMRPDSIEGHPVIEALKKKSTYCMQAQTVEPSVTLPCHMSLFHSVDPGRHGTTTNVYAPQVRPVSGLCEQLRQAGKRCAFFYNWEELRDLSGPDSLCYSEYYSGHIFGYEAANQHLCSRTAQFLKENDVDFTFLYLGWTDAAGHAYGWMSEEYLHAINTTCDRIGELLEQLGNEYTVILTADHGGHDRIHGTTMKEDMTIPMFFCGAPFAENKQIENVGIKDIAPTVAELLGADKAEEWEGTVIQ